jgi:sodium transport system permease protein
MHKELVRVFKNPKMLMSLLLPGILIYVLYSLMGGAMSEKFDTDAERAKAATYNFVVLNMPESPDPEYPDLAGVIELLGFNVTYSELAAGELDAKKAAIKKGELVIVLVFDEDFTTSFMSKESPACTAFYNPADTKSAYAFGTIFHPAFSLFCDGMTKLMVDPTLDPTTFEFYTAAFTPIMDEKRQEADTLAMIIPMILIMLLFSGCIAVTPESIAGEKERGTIATLLATPAKRGSIAVGKIAALSILSTISGVSSFIGFTASLPKLARTGSLFALYGFWDLTLLFFIVLSTVLFMVGTLAIVSSLSRNIKEATMFATPLMLLGAAVGILNMFLAVPTAFWYYLIPLYNASASIASVLTFEINIVNLCVTVFSNIVYVAALVFALTKIFGSEKIMFSK